MAQCFLKGATMPPESVRNYAKGKQFVPGNTTDIFGKTHNGRGYHTTYKVSGKTREAMDIGVRDSLRGLLEFQTKQGISEPKLVLGGQSLYPGLNTLYVVGSKSSILDMFQKANDAPEIVISPTLYIGICHWESLMGHDRFAVRIKADRFGKPDPKQNSKKPYFWDTDVTEAMQCIVKATSVHPLAFVLQIKNLFDRNNLS